MKGWLLTCFRALVFAVGAFALLAVGGITVRSSRDVALFIVGLTLFWILIEKIALSVRRKQPRKSPTH